MKYLDEYRDAGAARELLRLIHASVTQPWTLMEVCGGQTHSIVRHGLDRLLPESLELLHGPGCPVCVTPLEMVDRAQARVVDLDARARGRRLRPRSRRDAHPPARRERRPDRRGRPCSPENRQRPHRDRRRARARHALGRAAAAQLLSLSAGRTAALDVVVVDLDELAPGAGPFDRPTRSGSLDGTGR